MTATVKLFPFGYVCCGRDVTAPSPYRAPHAPILPALLLPRHCWRALATQHHAAHISWRLRFWFWFSTSAVKHASRGFFLPGYRARPTFSVLLLAILFYNIGEILLYFAIPSAWDVVPLFQLTAITPRALSACASLTHLIFETYHCAPRAVLVAETRLA